MSDERYWVRLARDDIPESNDLVIRARSENFRVWTPRDCGDSGKMTLELMLKFAGSDVP